MLKNVRSLFAFPMATLLALAAALLSGCGEPPPSVPESAASSDAGYANTVRQLAETAGAAETAFQKGKPDDAAALIEKAEPLESQVLAVPRPSLAAMEAATDLDDLYGRMLLSNRHYEWALFLFQKCSARWRYWQPQTEDTVRRVKRADSEIAECQRRMTAR
jgi:hypothetical protein